MDDKLHEQRQRGEFANMQGSEPTEGADRKEQRKRKQEGARETACSRLVLARYSILYLSHSLIPSSSCTVHSFVSPLLAPSFSLYLSRSLRVNLFSLFLSVLRARANTHVHSFRLCLITARIADAPVLTLSLSLSSPSLLLLRCRSRTGHVAPTRPPFFAPRHLFPSTLSSSYQSDTSAALWMQWRTHA